MKTNKEANKWHLIRNDNGEWICDENAVFFESNLEAGILQVYAARQKKPLHIQHGPNGTLWCYKHEADALNFPAPEAKESKRTLRIKKQSSYGRKN